MTSDIRQSGMTRTDECTIFLAVTTSNVLKFIFDGFSVFHFSNVIRC